MSDDNTLVLIEAALKVRDNAQTRGTRRVGAAVLSTAGVVHSGCNVQHRYHSGDVHAEVAAIVSMIGAGDGRIQEIVVVSDGQGIPPCGACCEWILEFGGPSCQVLWIGDASSDQSKVPVAELIPFSPPFD